MNALFSRVKTPFMKGGKLRTLVREGLAFSRIYNKSIVYIFEVTLKERNEAASLPKIDNTTFRILTNKTQIDELINNNFNLVFKPSLMKNRLEKGAIAFCIFIRKDLVSIGWAGMTETAQKAFNDYPYKIDFANNNACIGGNWTHPQYRNKGLATYRMFIEDQFLVEKGVIKHRCIIETSNAPAIRVHEKSHEGLDNRIVAKVVYLRILGLRFWRETPPFPN
jgi:hypothetical protein